MNVRALYYTQPTKLSMSFCFNEISINANKCIYTDSKLSPTIGVWALGAALLLQSLGKGCGRSVKEHMQLLSFYLRRKKTGK